MTQKILLVGATGMFGSHIAVHLLDQSEARLRLLLRPGAGAKKKDALRPLIEGRVEIIEGELSDRDSLDRAAEGVDVIICAVEGGPDVIVDGQMALAEAGKENGVRRILPSDYALDLFKATPGEHRSFNMRRQADEAIAKLGLEHVHVLQGAFMDMFLPGGGAIGEDKIVNYWGEGTERFEVTSIDDTARVVARVALDREVKSGKFAVAGDRISYLEATEIIEKQIGQSYQRHSLGSETDLRAAMKNENDPNKAVMLAYQLYMLNGQTALSDLQNNRYPDIKLQSFAQLVSAKLGT